MKKVTAAWQQINRKIDGLWERSPDHPADLFFVLLMGVFLFYLAWILPFNEAPDEKMRYLVPTYIYRHGTLPAGWDEEVLNKMWGISYAFHPILPYILGGYLMRIVGIFNSSEHALLMAARCINVFFGMGFYWYVLKISRRLFQNQVFRIYFVALLAMLPQLLYLFVYVNTDGTAVFSSAMLIYGWIFGMEQNGTGKAVRIWRSALPSVRCHISMHMDLRCFLL